jgi:chromosome segregation ATPase
MAATEQLLQELAKERDLRQAAEEERARLKRARDELAKECLLLEHRASEAEEALGAAKAELERLVASPSPTKTARTLQRDVELLLRELDREHETNKGLMQELAAAKADAAEAVERMLVAEKHVKILRTSRSKDKDGMDKNSTNAEKHARSQHAADSSSPVPFGASISINECHNKLSALKTVRDRLIAEMDAQAAELERLGVENAALSTTVLEAKGECERWEAQSQASLGQCDALKDLLEEGAAWGLSSVEGNDGSSMDAEARSRRLEQELLAASAREAELKCHVAALCAELSRCSTASAGLHRAVVPLLGGIEARLRLVLERSKERGREKHGQARLKG